MADENRNAEHFFLGVILAVILYLILRKEFSKLSRGGGGSTTISGPANPGKSDCGCGCAGGGQATSSNPGITPGAQSFNGTLAFPATVVSRGAQFAG